MFDLTTIKGFAKELGKPESTVYFWRKNGDLPAHIFKSIGGTVFVRVEKVKECIVSSP